MPKSNLLEFSQAVNLRSVNEKKDVAPNRKKYEMGKSKFYMISKHTSLKSGQDQSSNSNSANYDSIKKNTFNFVPFDL